MGLQITKLRMLEGENVTLVAQLRHNDKRYLTLEDVTTWGVRVHRVGESSLPIYSLLLQSPTIAMFENDVASVGSITSGDGGGPTSDTATFTRASGSWIDDRYFNGATITVTGFGSAAEGNGTFIIQSMTDLVLTVIDTPDTVTTTDTGGTVVLDDASAHDGKRLINDELWELGGDPAGHNLQYVLDQADLTPNEMEGTRVYIVTIEMDCSDVVGKNYGDEFKIYEIEVLPNQAR